MNALRFTIESVGITQRDLTELSGINRSRLSRLATFPADSLAWRISYAEAMAIQSAFNEVKRVDSDPPDFLALL